MAGKRKTTEPSGPGVPPNLKVPRTEAESRIATQIYKGKQLLDIIINSPDTLKMAQVEYSKWNSFNEELLRRLFDSSEIAEEYSRFVGSLTISMYGPSFGEQKEDYYNDVQKKINRLESIKERLSLFEEPVGLSQRNEQQATSISNDIFIVHGREEGTKEKVSRLLERLGFKPIILHEQPNLSRTIIEKLEAHSSVAYAVILLTPDDMGGLNSSEPELSPRARQNVVFELGYFIGKLGREKVCALYLEDIELPSDLHGVLYVKLDEAGAWKLKLARELNAAGLDIDLNKLVSKQINGRH
jgi:predicted nucleotide-binding protein